MRETILFGIPKGATSLADPGIRRKRLRQDRFPGFVCTSNTQAQYIRLQFFFCLARGAPQIELFLVTTLGLMIVAMEPRTQKVEKKHDAVPSSWNWNGLKRTDRTSSLRV